MKKVYLENINLNNYRNFDAFAKELAPEVNIIIGPNGSGKTNILESISLLSPGKGLKSANFEDICQFGGGKWNSSFRMQSKVGSAEVATSFDVSGGARKISYNGSKLGSSELANLLGVVWLTPQMEGLFLGSSNDRRRFLDRIVYNFNSRHVKNLTKYEYLMRERNKILSDYNYESQSPWLTTLERQMAGEAEAIDFSRRQAINLMQSAIDKLETEFPKAKLAISDLHEGQEAWSDFKENYYQELAAARKKDAYAGGRTSFGVHKVDFLVSHKTKKQPAKLCSTGEQKALLISVTLASIEFILQNTETTPILLLDELFVHLDDIRKKHLADYINNSKLQTFITTTDIIGFEELASKANIIKL